MTEYLVLSQPLSLSISMLVVSVYTLLVFQLGIEIKDDHLTALDGLISSAGANIVFLIT